jgi:hypothetical protein
LLHFNSLFPSEQLFAYLLISTPFNLATSFNSLTFTPEVLKVSTFAPTPAGIPKALKKSGAETVFVLAVFVKIPGVMSDLEAAIREKVSPGFWEGLVYDDSKVEADRVIKDNKGVLTRYVQTRADMYHMQNPNEDPEVSMKKAIDDFQANATYVAGNVIVTEGGYELHKTMGVSGLGKNAADTAVRDFLADAGPKLWPTQYTKNAEGTAGALWRGLTTDKGNSMYNPFPLVPSVAPRDAPVKITYNARSGIITFDLYTDNTRKQTLGDTKVFNAADIGKWYSKKATEPSAINKMFDAIFEAPRALGRKLEEKNKDGMPSPIGNVYNIPMQ